MILEKKTHMKDKNIYLRESLFLAFYETSFCFSKNLLSITDSKSLASEEWSIASERTESKNDDGIKKYSFGPKRWENVS